MNMDTTTGSQLAVLMAHEKMDIVIGSFSCSFETGVFIIDYFTRVFFIFGHNPKPNIQVIV